jgi:hypothetical protein
MESYLNLEDIESWEYVDCPVVYDMTIQDNHNYFLGCGVLAHNSGKTISLIHLLVTICDHNRGAGLQIGMFRYTLKDAREKLFEQDFKKCLREYIQIYDPNCSRAEKQSPEYELWGNTFYFRGLEDSTEQVSYDIVFVNEMLEVPEKAFISGLMMRCKMLFVGDWNPKYTDHWAFGFEGQPNTYYTKTTYRNNKHCPPTIVKEIESYCPWMIEDIGKPIQDRRPNLGNLAAGTVDEYMWTVYGEGQRCAREGLIFRDVTYIDRIPTGAEHYWYGLDYANTVGVYAFAEVCRYDGGLAYDSPIYVNNLNSLEDFYRIFKAYYEGKRDERPDRWMVICDSARPQNKDDLNGMAWADGLNVQFENCKKFTGCVEWRIDLMKRHKMFLVRREHIRREQENYRYKMVNGINTNEPEKNGFDHFFDAAGMALQYEVSLR